MDIVRVNGDIVDVDQRTALEVAGQVANHHAARSTFQDYRERKSENTIRAQDAALSLFAQFLGEAGVRVNGDELATDPQAWKGVTVGLVKAFKRWQRDQGYAISTINARLSHIRTYAGMAVEAGVIPPGEGVKIDSVKGYDSREAVRIDERREQTRKSTKKEEPVKLTEEQAEELMSNHPDTPQGRRDRVLMHLALKHGLRVSEIAALNTDDVTLTYDEGDVISSMMRFYRPKVAGTEQETGEHLIMNGTLDAITQYVEKDAIPGEKLMRGSRRGGNLTTPGVTERSLSMRIKTLGENVGIEGLTAHDCRHYAATRDGKRGKSVKYIMSKFGWTSAQTAMRYVHQDGPVVVD